MGDPQITLSNGAKLSLAQATTLGNLCEEHGVEYTHWHVNHCGCCVSLHTPIGGYVIGWDGGSSFYPGATCSCGKDVDVRPDVEH